MIRHEEINMCHYKLFHDKAYIGDLCMEVDGYFYYEPLENRALFNCYLLREIADYLDIVNKDWDNKVKKSVPLP